MNTSTQAAFHVATDPRGVMTVSMNVPGRPMNVFTADVMSELENIVTEIESRPDLKLVVFRSDKESGFLAGADVRVIADITNPSQAGRLIDNGQQLFHRIDHLRVPTVVVIHGPCLGGGLEWALACDYRIARDNSSTKIGLPEIKLGLIPGWGGTQRLPQRVGLVHSLGMILQGKTVSAYQAAKIGLVDRAISPDDWDDGVERFIDERLRNRTLPKRDLQKRIRQALESSLIGRSLVMRAIRKKIRSKSNQYPALGAAILAIEAGLSKPGAGYMTERTEFVKLLATPTCRNLLNLFFARESARDIKTWSIDRERSDFHSHEIRRVGVIGAGAMGAGIGQFAAMHGYNVTLREISETAADEGRKRVGKLMNSYADRSRLDADKRRELGEQITVTANENGIGSSDLIVEAAVERLDAKQQIFQQLDALVSPDCILATNTSSLSVDAIAAATAHPERVAGLHFFNPVHRMELVEVVRGEHSSDETITRLVAFVRSLGKTPVVTKDAPGFLVNRVLFPYLGEAVLMVGEGRLPADIDRELRGFGMPMGPLELIDQVGVDIAMHVAGSLGDVLADLEPVADLLSDMVEQEELGRKSSIGFYRYHDGKPVDRNARVTARPGIHEDATFIDDKLSNITRRLVYPMLAEAVRCHEQQIVTEPWMVDLGMVLGTGFAPHRGGPLRVIDSIGAEIVFENMKRLRVIHGERFTPPESLTAMAATGGRFYVRDGSIAGDEAEVFSYPVGDR